MHEKFGQDLQETDIYSSGLLVLGLAQAKEIIHYFRRRTMTDLLQRAFAAIAQLPDEQQNAIASRLLTELADDFGK